VNRRHKKTKFKNRLRKPVFPDVLCPIFPTFVASLASVTFCWISAKCKYCKKNAPLAGVVWQLLHSLVLVSRLHRRKRNFRPRHQMGEVGRRPGEAFEHKATKENEVKKPSRKPVFPDVLLSIFPTFLLRLASVTFCCDKRQVQIPAQTV